MKLRAKPMNLEVGGKNIVIMNGADAEALGLHALERVRLKKDGSELVAIVDIAKKIAGCGEIITTNGINSALKIKNGDVISVAHEKEPESVFFIRKKINGLALEPEELKEIVKDTSARKLSDIELASFITAIHIHGMGMEETEHFSKAMIGGGKRLDIKGMVVDKHSVGGIPGDKTSIVAMPIIAASGLVIPKTSSRAITSPAGTADRMEVLAPVNFTIEEIEKIVKKTGGCLVWGGALDIAPADDVFIQIEFPIGIDPMLLPSILSKKKAVGADYVVIDIPTGRGAKIKTVGDAHELSEEFVNLGKRLGMTISCGITFGEQPLGYAIGPALEAREALQTLMGKGPADVVEKTSNIVGILFEMVGKGNAKDALKILNSGKAEKKFREIIAEQGGNAKIKPSEIAVGEKTADIKSEKDGRVLWIKNQEIAAVAKEAGAPKDKGAGIMLHKKMGSRVRKGEKLFTIYAENSFCLENAIKLAERAEPIIVGKEFEEKMLLERFPSKIPHRKAFMFER
ncbi:MAG: AMP phosphorylase [Nanoarchaeota archaeon]|nr:AMP phosphorylase [Nanoarchaeota archaeon]